MTKRQATKVLNAVRREFSAYIGDSGPTLIKDWDWSGVTPWAIVWEGGPYEWAHLAAGGGIDEEMAYLSAEFGSKPKPHDPVPVPDGYYIEPITGWAIGLYRI